MLNSNDDIKRLKTALYVRLSREDGDKEESNSVLHQRDILRQYVKDHSYLTIYDEYVDDGYSGTNFNRPAFQRMVEDIQKGEIQAVIVKDLSRFARDYIMAGMYIERYFPSWNVRFIAIGDNYDSETAEDSILLPIQNLFNEFHARDTSKKVQRVMRSMQQEGKCVAAFVPYGYQKNPLDKHTLIPDEFAAIIVNKIFDDYLSGMGMQTIAKRLNAENILCPTEYKKENGSLYANSKKLETTSYWTVSTIKRILENEVYVGTLVQGKSKRSINKKPVRVPKEEWIRVPNAHEPIVDEEVFQKAQALLKRNARTMKLDEEWSMFAGVIKCGDCGRSLVKTEWNGKITYKCGTYKRIGKQYCSPHAIKEKVLIELLKTDLNVILSKVQDLSSLLKNEEYKSNVGNAEKKRQKLQIELEKCVRKKAEAYDDYKEELITKEEFLAYKKKCDIERQQLETQLNMLAEETTHQKKILENSWVQKLLEQKQIDEIDRQIVLDMVHEIQVYEENTIKIIYNFSDELDYLLNSN